MSEIRRHVMSLPLFDTHEHQEGFSAIESKKGKLDHKGLWGFLPDDLRTAGLENPAEAGERAFWEAWRFVRTTGYGRAVRLTSRLLLGVEYREENAGAIAAALSDFTAHRTGKDIYRQVFSMAGIQWAICDEWWTSPTDLKFFTGEEHPDFFGHALRYDAVIGLSDRDTVLAVERALDTSIQSLSDLDRALDEHAAKAQAAGRLAAMKSALAYKSPLRFLDPDPGEAERAFSKIMLGEPVDTASWRSCAPPLASYLFHKFVQRALDFDLPAQIHVGALSHNSLDPRQGDPSGMIPIFRRYPRVRFDLFHAGWPFCDLMAAIGKSFPNVYLDLCWGWAVDPVMMERVLDEWLSAVPHNKILGFGGDTSAPYTVIGYAAQAREGIARVLEHKMARGEYDLETAKEVADRIMYKNGCELYPKVGKPASK